MCSGSLSSDLVRSLWTFIGSAPVIFSMSVEFLAHGMSGILSVFLSGIHIKYSEVDKGISWAEILDYEEKSPLETLVKFPSVWI